MFASINSLSYVLIDCCNFIRAAWEPFRDFIPEDERNCFIAAYSKRLTSSDADVQVDLSLLLGTFDPFLSLVL
jgi:hypothetical protein